MADAATVTAVPVDTLPLRIFCHGHYPAGHPLAGQRCRNRRPIATVERGLVVVAYREHNGKLRRTVDPRSTECPECGAVRTFAGGVAEELGGSSGFRSGPRPDPLVDLAARAVAILDAQRRAGDLLPPQAVQLLEQVQALVEAVAELSREVAA